MKKSNSTDSEIRALSRQADAGDHSVVPKLHALQKRAGVPLNERWGYDALCDAVEEEHGLCEDNTCDISAALNAGYCMWAARLLEGATEAPKTEAALASFGMDIKRFTEQDEEDMEGEREEFVASVPHRECQDCGATVWGEGQDWCDNCMRPLRWFECQKCAERLHQEGGVWVGDTGGDACESGVHEPENVRAERPDPIPGELPADLRDKDILRHVDLDGYRLVTWAAGPPHGPAYDSRIRVGYRLIAPSGETIYEGDDLRPPGGVDPESDQVIRDLIGFLTTASEDEDAQVTPRQRQFLDDEAEQLSLYALDDGPLPADVLGGEDATEEATREATRLATEEATRLATEEATRLATAAVTGEASRHALREATSESYQIGFDLGVEDAIEERAEQPRQAYDMLDDEAQNYTEFERGYRSGYRLARFRENPDEDLRSLERQAAAGDDMARARLERARARVGVTGERKYLANLAQHAVFEWRAAKALEEGRKPLDPRDSREFYSIERKLIAVGVKAVIEAAKIPLSKVSVTTPAHWTGGVDITGPTVFKSHAEGDPHKTKKGFGGRLQTVLDEDIARQLWWLFYTRSEFGVGRDAAGRSFSHVPLVLHLNVRDRQGDTPEQRHVASMTDMASTSEGPSLDRQWWQVFKDGVKRGLEGKRKNV